MTSEGYQTAKQTRHKHYTPFESDASKYIYLKRINNHGKSMDEILKMK